VSEPVVEAIAGSWQIGEPSRSGYPVSWRGEVRIQPRVTSILGLLDKPGLVSWAENEGREAAISCSWRLHAGAFSGPEVTWGDGIRAMMGPEKQHRRTAMAAADIGTAAHKAIEWETRRRMDLGVAAHPLIPEPSLLAYMAWEDWAKQVAFIPLTVEQRVCHWDAGYAGTVDVIATVNGILTLIDYKTAKAIYDEAWLQLGAYHAALAWMASAGVFQGEVPKRAMVVRLPKQLEHPSTEIVEIPPGDLLAAGEAFLSLMPIWRWKHGRPKQK